MGKILAIPIRAAGLALALLLSAAGSPPQARADYLSSRLDSRTVAALPVHFEAAEPVPAETSAPVSGPAALALILVVPPGTTSTDPTPTQSTPPTTTTTTTPTTPTTNTTPPTTTTTTTSPPTTTTNNPPPPPPPPPPPTTTTTPSSPPPSSDGGTPVPTPSTTPEPTSLMLGLTGAGMAGLMGWARRRRKQPEDV